MSTWQQIGSAIVRQDQSRAADPRTSTKYNPERTKAKARNARITKERAMRDEESRTGRVNRFMGKSLPGGDVGSPPAEPSAVASGYGAQLQQVEDAARAQSQRMSDDDFNRKLVQEITARRRVR